MLAVAWPWSLAAAQPPAPAGPAVTITLGPRHGHVTPVRQGCVHTGAGNIDVAQPAPDTIVITMAGAAVATAQPVKDSVATLDFDLDQALEIAVADPKVKGLKVTLEGRVIGLLRSHAGCSKKCCGTAGVSVAHAALVCEPTELLALSLVPHSVACGENLSINDRAGPATQTIVPGRYTFHQTFSVTASHPRSVVPCKAASAEFAPDPALDPLWISYWEPFHGAAKKDFGFQVTIKVAPE